MRWMKIVLVTLLLLVGTAATAVVVVWANLPQFAAALATKVSGRNVTIDGLRLTPGWWVRVELRDLNVANLPGGTRPDMVAIGLVTGEVSLLPLLHGTLVARSVRVERGDLLLEHVGSQPNWRNGPKRPEPPGGGRGSFPTLLGVELHGTVTFRTRSGHALVTKLDGVRVEAAQADAPAQVVGPGSYQGVPVQLDLKLGSYNQLHEVDVPFPADARFSSGETVLQFGGTLMDPLGVDGIRGRLNLVAPTPEALEAIVGAGSSPAPPLRLAGALTHDKALWKLEQAKGALGAAAVDDGTLQFLEGSAPDRMPDKVDVNLHFGQVDLDRLLHAFIKGGSGRGGGETVPEAAPNPEVAARLEATGLTYDKFSLAEPKLSVALEPGVVRVAGVSFGLLGGQVRAEGRLRAGADGKSAALNADVSATGLEVSQLRRAFGAEEVPLTGRMDIHGIAEGGGLDLSTGRASVVATMAGGSVSERWVELASTDLAGLLRSSRTMVPMTCLLAVANVRGGRAQVGPVRVRSSQGTIAARGAIDLVAETLDLVVASEAGTTGALALDLPVRLSGKIDDPSVAPASAAAGQAARSNALGSLAVPLREYVQRSGCAR